MAESKTFNERLTEYKSILDKYLESLGINYILYNKEVESVLMLSYKQIQNLDSQSCDEYAFLLAQYSLCLTKESNREKAVLNWGEKQLELMIAHYEKQYTGGDKYTKYELLRSRVILGDSAAKVLNSIILQASGRVQELENISTRVELMSKTLSNLARSKK